MPEPRPACCARRDAQVTRAQGDLASLARRASRRGSKVTIEMLDNAKAEVVNEKFRRAEHEKNEHGAS